jgi:hypothetical protein
MGLARAMRSCVSPTCALILFHGGGSVAAAQQPAPASGVKQAWAVRVQPDAVRLDGRLDDEAWRTAEPITDFQQAEPVEGAAPSDGLEVRFLYDDTAVYVGARMFRRSSTPIQAPVSRRDEGGQAEYLQVEVDSYLDRRTAYMFGVTASGVRLDHYHASDDENSSDAGFDPVWHARTSSDATGWTAELWLPFSQLRFTDLSEQVWGLNVKRWQPELNEETYWVLVGRTERGWSSRFGELRGIEGVRPGRRLELLPYAAGSARTTGNRDRANPFDKGVNIAQRAGADLKVGLGPNLTLEATVNPDFGQIEADPAEVNLSAFETFFSERRPFFLEGSNLLQGQSGNFFYSRRIGARPTAAAAGDYVDYPATTTILGATKLTGRLASGTSIGALAAVTGEEHAETVTGRIFSDVRVTPRAFWSVTRVEQEFGDGGSNAGAHFTALHRDMMAGDPLASLLTRNAMTGGVDAQIRFGDRMYLAQFSAGFTHVAGEPAALERIQRGNGHLFQRPDQPNVRLDPTRRTMSGGQIRLAFDKNAGRHWLWGGSTQFESPEFEPNDMGRLVYAGDIMSSARITYRETQPGRWLRAYSVQLSSSGVTYYDRDLGTRLTLSPNGSVTLPNFWSATWNTTFNLRGQDVQLTRGGPSMGTGRRVSVTASLRNATSSNTQWNGSIGHSWDEFGGFSWTPSFTASMRPSPALRVEFSPEYTRELVTRQYLTSLDGGGAATYGRRHIFGFIHRTTLVAQVRATYTFKPDLNLDVYAEPFAASGRYDGFGELVSARSRFLREYGKDGTSLDRQADGGVLITDGDARFTLANRDFNVRSFRSNIVLRWEWRPGSTLYMVWQQNRASSTLRGDPVNVGDLFDSLRAPGDNVLAIKTTFWIAL